VKRLVVLFLWLGISVGLWGQETKTLTNKPSRLAGERQTQSRYIITPGSDAFLMTVRVWGEVQRPGLYDVPIGTDLIEIISAAGGPTSKANLSKVRVIRTDSSQSEGEVQTISVKRFVEKGDVAIIPEIRPFDTIVVPMRPSQYVLQSLSWTQQFMSLVSIYAMITYYISIARRN
jgi:hypothetical protein